MLGPAGLDPLLPGPALSEIGRLPVTGLSHVMTSFGVPLESWIDLIMAFYSNQITTVRGFYFIVLKLYGRKGRNLVNL